jgi:hypothetical protein
MKQKPVRFIPIGQIPTEKVLWHRDIKRGIIHKQVIIEERITNIRILRYNVETHTLLSQISLRSNPDVLVANSRRSSQSYGTGLYGGGTFMGSRTGTSLAIGDVVIMENGVINTELRNVADPDGIKQLINTLKREVEADQKQTLLRQGPISMKAKAPTATAIFCKNCGTELPAGSNFCNKCGSVQN